VVRDRHTLLQSHIKPALIKQDTGLGLDELALEDMFQTNTAPLLLSEERANYRSSLLPHSMASDMVGEVEEDKRMEEDVEAGVGGFGRDEGISVLHLLRIKDVVGKGDAQAQGIGCLKVSFAGS
jgi:hypothetical protein